MIIRYVCRATAHGTSILGNKHLLNKLPKRWSGHNAMEIEPSNFAWKKFKDLLHFYTILGLVPVSVISAITGIRSNPELVEIPEGYEPRHWEYYKHPITRFMARYMFATTDLDEECNCSQYEQISETRILVKVQNDVDKIMSFYNDHRSKYFQPYYGETHRQARDFIPHAHDFLMSNEGHHVDLGYQPLTPVPVEGYKPASMLDEGSD